MIKRVKGRNVSIVARQGLVFFLALGTELCLFKVYNVISGHFTS